MLQRLCHENSDDTHTSEVRDRPAQHHARVVPGPLDTYNERFDLVLRLECDRLVSIRRPTSESAPAMALLEHQLKYDNKQNRLND